MEYSPQFIVGLWYYIIINMRRFFLVIIIFLLLISFAQAKVYYRSYHPKHVLLTFDDGPTPGVTDKILDHLKEENIKATFFIIGQKAAKSPKLLQRILDEGHEIGNHTYSHVSLDGISDKDALDEIRWTSNLIFDLTGDYIDLFRPPHGRITKKQTRLIQDSGYDIVLWTVNADDFWREGRGMRSPLSIANRVNNRITKGDIILMHDNSQQIIDALPMIIKHLKKRGFYFVTVSKLRN